MTLDPATLVAVLAVYLVAGLVKGAMGFGLPVVAVALLPFFVPIEVALALNAVVILFTNLQQIRQGGAPREGIRAAWALMIGMTIMVPVGAVFVSTLDKALLSLIVACFVLIFVTLSFVNPALRTPTDWTNRVGFGTGLVSGFVGGLTSTPGPIFVMFMVSLHLKRSVYMTALGFIMALFGMIAAASYVWVGLLRWEHAAPALLSVPLAMVGMWIGDRWARRMANETFRKAVLVLLGVLAIALIRRSLD